MRTPSTPRTHVRRSALTLALLRTAASVAACHPGNAEAKRLRETCDGGDVKACNTLATRLQKGEYVLRDDGRAAQLFTAACDGGVAGGCSSLGAIYQTGKGVKRDSARAPRARA